MDSHSGASEQTTGTGHTGGDNAQAVRTAAKRSSCRINVPFLGTLELPPSDQLAFLGGVVTLGAVGVVDWPVVAVLVTGHVLAHNRHVLFLRDFGEALERA
ncbi:hypothetical protein ACQPZU_11140 [Saccharomonospora azurea]|uniref:hypothetical protein n=1 Tax=Saccharomonospora azurea TaxID=40988 RepID=UPI00332927CF